jgi:hypothetical protein
MNDKNRKAMFAKTKVYVATSDKQFHKSPSNYNWVKKGDILSVPANLNGNEQNGKSMVSLDSRKSTTHFKIVERDVNYHKLIAESIKKAFKLTDSQANESASNDMKVIKRLQR